MYEPITNGEKPKYPIFKPVSGKVIPGFGASEFIVLTLMVVIAIVVFFAAGQAKIERAVALSDMQVELEQNMLMQMRNALYTKEQMAIELAGGVTQYVDSETGATYTYLSEEELARLTQAAAERGIDAQTTDEELAVMPSATEAVVEDAIPPFFRGIILAVPILLFVGVSVELDHGVSLKTSLARYASWRKQQKIFMYKGRWYFR